MDFWIYIYTLVMLTCGALPTYLYMRSQNRDHSKVAYVDGYEDGWNGALQSPSDVKKAHEYFYGNRP